MPVPFIIIGGAAVVSIGSSIHSTMKTRKWKKIHAEALEKCKANWARTKAVADDFNAQAEEFGKFRVNSMEHLEVVAEFLQKAKVKHRDFEDLNASIPEVVLLHWKELHQAIIKSIGIGTAGIVGGVGAATATVAGLYQAAGIFGVASTGTRIANLTGAAAHSARMAWLGGGALSAGGAGMAGGLATLGTAASVAAIPIGLGAAGLGQWKAHQLKGKVEEALRDFAKSEAKMRQQAAIMNAGMQRTSELRDSIQNAASALTGQLAQSDENNLEDLHQVYKLAHMLAQLLEEPVLTPEQQEVLQG